MDDAVDAILAQWARERPDLDVSAMGVIGRIGRLASQLESELHPVFARAGLGGGEFDVLATLRRSGEPFALTPSELMSRTMVTSGAVTKRVDRLVAKGLVSRERSDRDGRGRVVALTRQGRALVDQTTEEHVANEERLLRCLSDAEREELARLLSKLLVGVGQG